MSSNNKNSTTSSMMYLIVILASALSVIGIFYCGFKIFLFALNAAGDSRSIVGGFSAVLSLDGLLKIGKWLVLIIGLGLSQKPLFDARVKYRHILDFNEEGMSKRYESYDRLSRKERDAIDKQRLAESERILDGATLRKITHPGSENPDEDMQKLIGLDNVKKEMHEMAARMQYEKQIREEKAKQNGKKKSKDKDEEISSMHMCFLGPPGTGKTTCARIMAGFLFKYGYIKENKCIEVDGNFLKGEYQGETTKKTQKLIQKAMGGVLFIDEAYALLERKGGGYGQEAIATIVKAMEDHKGEFIIIFAGYDNEMKELVNSNPGIYSRIKHYLWFGNYTIKDLSQIFKYMAREKGYVISTEAINKFEEKMENEIKTRNFGNARSVRNCLEKSINKHAVNIIDNILDKEKTYIICAEDIEMQTKQDLFFNF
jgi:stage V sporulation protein K